jgi:hypothetical protein
MCTTCCGLWGCYDGSHYTLKTLPPTCDGSHYTLKTLPPTCDGSHCTLKTLPPCVYQDATLDVTTCTVMRTEIPDTVAATHAVVKCGRVDVPVYVDEWSELHGPVLGSRMAKVMPINQVSCMLMSGQSCMVPSLVVAWPRSCPLIREAVWPLW